MHQATGMTGNALLSSLHWCSILREQHIPNDGTKGTEVKTLLTTIACDGKERLKHQSFAVWCYCQSCAVHKDIAAHYILLH